MDNKSMVVEFRKALKRLFDSADGKIVAESLEQMFVNQSAMDSDTPECTFYRLGRKEFVQGLLRDAKTDLNEEILKVKTGEVNE